MIILLSLVIILNFFADFPSKFNKPQVVRLLQEDQSPTKDKSIDPSNAVELGPELDTTAPFLVYSHRRRTKVFAEHVIWHESKKAYQPSGEILEVPKDYIGTNTDC